MMFSRRGVVLAVLLTAVCGPAWADQVVVSDAFSGGNSAPLSGRWPDTADLPGNAWNVVSYDLSGRFTGTVVTAVGNPAPAAWLSCVGNSVGAIAISIASQNAYVKPAQFTISADIGAFNGFVNPALGFYASLPTQEKRDPIDAHFTGLRLTCNTTGDAANGTLTLVQDGAASTSVKYTGTFDLKALHHLSYDVDAHTGAISNVTLQGSTSDYSVLKSTAFTDPATAFAAIQAISAARDNPACADNFKINTTASVSANTTPPAAPAGLTAANPKEPWGWNCAELKWSVTSGKYSVYRGTTPGGEGEQAVATDLTEPTYLDRDLPEGATYYYKVKASNPNGTSESNEASVAVVNPLYRDKTDYPPYTLNWNVSTDLQQVTGVFPHPVQAGRALLATQTGVYLTDDAGRTWNALPQATSDNVGPIVATAFHPLDPNTFYLASRTKGVWATSDAGKTFRQIGAKAKGMASDTVTDLVIYPGDSSHQTLLAVHGDSAVGLSRSRDGGQTWDVVNTDNHFKRVFGGDGNSSQVYLFGSTTKEPDIQSVYTCHTVGEYPAEVVRDVVPTDLFFAPISWRQTGVTYLATSDSGLYRIDNGSVFGMSYDVTKLPYPGVDGWSSIGMTWGSSADTLNLFLYDPTKAGLVVVTQPLGNKELPVADISTGVTANDGLPVSPLTKEGATLRPNANGTICYAVANGALAIGRTPDNVPMVNCAPVAFETNPRNEQDWRDLAEALGKFANVNGKTHTLDDAKLLLQSHPDLLSLYHACQLTVTATVSLKPAPPTSVTIDLSRYGGEPDTQLFDDGQHNDGAANDGVYGTTFAFLPGRYAPRGENHEWRCAGPGRVAMGVVATYAGGKRVGTTVVVSYFEQLFDLKMWGEGVGSAAADVENGAKAEAFLNPLAPKQPAYAPRRHKGDVAVRVTLPKGPWTVHFKTAYNRHDIDSYAGLSFFIKLEAGEAPKEIYMQLRDEPEFSPPTTTDKVPVLHGLTINADYQRVSLPISQILGPGSSLQTDHLSEIILSGTSDAPATLVLDDLSAIATYPPPPPEPEPPAQ